MFYWLEHNGDIIPLTYVLVCFTSFEFNVNYEFSLKYNFRFYVQKVLRKEYLFFNCFLIICHFYLLRFIFFF